MMKVTGVFFILASLVLLAVSIIGPLALSFLEISSDATPPRPAVLGSSIALPVVSLSVSVLAGIAGFILLVVGVLKK